MALRLQVRPYAFALSQPLQTAHGQWQQRTGWLLRLEDPAAGRVGWGEVSPLNPADRKHCQQAFGDWLAPEPVVCRREALETALLQAPGPLSFALGAALAELDGLVGEGFLAGAGQPWLPSPPSAHLLPAGAAMPAALARLLLDTPADQRLTVKWKVAAAEADLEWSLLPLLLKHLPPSARLRLDANGGWNRITAERWAAALESERRLEWLEQPLAADDLEGLTQLAERLPVALDESLQAYPGWSQGWPGWQVRRPALEGDPRPLLHRLCQGEPRLMLSTAFETGIGLRWLALLAALQASGPTPAAPGLAPGWCPPGPLFSEDPQQVWAAAGAIG